MAEQGTALERMRARVDHAVHHPATEFTLVILIVASVAMILVEPALPWGSDIRLAVETAGDALTGVFIVELSARFWVARKKARFFKRYWLDIIAVLPLARALRFFRVLRLLRLFRAGLLLNRRLSVFRETVTGALHELTILATLTLTLVLLGALMMQVGEGAENAHFGSFHDSLWFSIYSMIGGEPIGGSPRTDTGRVVTLVLMLGGMTVFGMFVGTVSASMMARIARRMELNEMALDELTGHVVICGWNRSGPTVVRELFHPGSPRDRAVVIVTEEEGMPRNMPTSGIRAELLYHHAGDYTTVEVLEEVRIAEASVCILLADSLIRRSDQDTDARTVLAGLTIERLAPEIFTCAQLHNPENSTVLKMSGVEEIVVGDWYSGVILGSVTRNRGLVSVLGEILTTRYGNTFHKLTVGPEQAGRTVGELHRLLKEKHRAVLLSLESRLGEGAGKVRVNPPASEVVAEGDTLVIVSEQPVRW